MVDLILKDETNQTISYGYKGDKNSECGTGHFLVMSSKELEKNEHGQKSDEMSKGRMIQREKIQDYV